MHEGSEGGDTDHRAPNSDQLADLVRLDVAQRRQVAADGALHAQVQPAAAEARREVERVGGARRAAAQQLLVCTEGQAVELLTHRQRAQAARATAIVAKPAWLKRARGAVCVAPASAYGVACEESARAARSP